LIQDERTEACTHVKDLIEQRLKAVRQKIQNLVTLEDHLEAALAKCSQALMNETAGTNHEYCPVLISIAQSEAKNEE
jgi:hypothetical protein